MTSDERVARYIELTSTKRQMEENLRPVKAELDELEPLIVEDFQAVGQRSVNRNGFCVYLSRDISVKSIDGDTAAIVDVLRRARLGELIGISHPRLKAFCKERMFNKATDSWEVDPAKLPPSLRQVVTVTEYSKVCCKKS